MRFLIVAGLLLASLASPAFADDMAQKWVVRGGLTQLTLAKDLDLTVGGGAVPGAELSIKPHITPSIAIGRYVSDHWLFMATLGLPPHIKVNGGGSIAPYGKLLETTYGPTAFTFQYHPVKTGMIRPYVGAGVSYMIIFSTKDGSVQNTKMTNDLAPAFEVGTDIMFNARHGMFIDVKKALLKTTATGTLGGFPVVGKAKIAPWVVSAGATFRF